MIVIWRPKYFLIFWVRKKFRRNHTRIINFDFQPPRSTLEFMKKNHSLICISEQTNKTLRKLFLVVKWKHFCHLYCCWFIATICFDMMRKLFTAALPKQNKQTRLMIEIYLRRLRSFSLTENNYRAMGRTKWNGGDMRLI